MEIKNEEGLEFVDIREDYVPESIKVFNTDSIIPLKVKTDESSGEFEKNLMRIIGDLEAEENTLKRSPVKPSPISTKLSEQEIKKRITPNLTESRNCTSNDSLFRSQSPLRTLKSALLNSSPSMRSSKSDASLIPYFLSDNDSIPHLKHNLSTSSFHSLNGQKSVSFNESIDIDTFNVLASPNSPTYRSTDFVNNEPTKIKQKRAPFILNALGVGARNESSDSDESYETDDSDASFEPLDNHKNKKPKTAILSEVVENVPQPTNDEEMDDYVAVNQMQKEYFEKRELFIRHKMVEKGFNDQDGYEADYFGNDSIDKESGMFAEMTFKPQASHIKYPVGAVDRDILDYVLNNQEVVEEEVNDFPISDANVKQFF